MDIAKLKAMLIKHEGFKLKPYVDTVGKVTIGVGHNLTDKGLTARQIGIILDDDVADVMALLLRQAWFRTLDDIRQCAIADMTFDLQGKIFGFHDMIDAIQQKDWQRASDELLDSEFAKQTGQRAIDLAQMLLVGQGE